MNNRQKRQGIILSTKSKEEGKSNCWQKYCEKNKVRVKNYIENFKEIFERVKSWNYKCRLSHAKMVELEIGFKGLFDSMLEKDA